MATQTVDQLLESARELLGSEDYLGARVLINQTLALDPFDAKLWNYRSIAHLKLGYPELAFTDAARGVQLLDDKLAKTTLSIDDRNDSVFLKLDILYSCLLAAESLNSFETALHFIRRLLTNAHLLSDEARRTLLEKRALFEAKTNEIRNTFIDQSNSLGVSVDHITNIGTMRVTKYPWDDFEPFCTESDIENQLKELNTMLEPFAPKLMVAQM
ncbi:unnamed protein product [Adineta steineri]|uniref:Uncharacterized protein n=1 Tax=Adineta steineri TaxID=433720 RepID=A0A819E500_9BILA|nr:unnamed protein product [Adineta steineri]CAF3844373.1 unnamed protein product [Adineta steineri]